MPACRENISAATWPVEPAPDEPLEISPGRCLASAMNSFTVRTGSAGLTTNTSGVSLVMEIAAKSLIGS